MAFTKYNTEDSVISAEVVVRGAWTNDALALTSFFTSSVTSSANSQYFTNIYDTATTSSLQFAIQYGHISGSGSTYINSGVAGISPSRDVYGQYRTLIYGTETTNFSFNNVQAQDIYVINIARARFRESIKAGSFNLTLTSGSGGGAITRNLSDDSNTTLTTNFLGSNRYYNIVSGSNGTQFTADTTVYGYLFPDLGIAILNASSSAIVTPTRTANTNGQNAWNLWRSMVTGSYFALQSQETISSRYFFTRVKNQEFNYTTNPSIIDDQGNLTFSTLINNPQTYITTIGLYNDNNELLAVAKLSKPLVKDFTKELLIRVKLDY